MRPGRWEVTGRGWRQYAEDHAHAVRLAAWYRAVGGRYGGARAVWGLS